MLFEIDVDLNKAEGLIVADVSKNSDFPDEKEILFGLCTTFVTTTIRHDEKHNVWYIGMILSSEMFKLNEEYTKHIEKSLTYTDAPTLLGIYFCEMSSDYSAGINHFHQHLRKMKFDDPNRAKVYHSMARVYCLMGKYEHAIEYFRRAMLLQRQWSSGSNYLYADTLSDLAVTYSEINDTSRAIRFHEKALNIFRKLLGENDFDMPLYYTQLAYTYWKVKQYEDAHALLVNSLSIFKEDTRSNLAGLCPAKHTMGLVKCALGQKEEGTRYFHEALELRQKIFANDHSSVGRSYYDLANIYMETSNVQMALEYAQNAFIIYQAKLPESHPDLKCSLELVNRLRSVQAHDTSVSSNRNNFEQK